ncbi:DNA repair protein RecO [Marinobacter caseinilyticus]|uniref:DNA repair protein RecO n=1 Tax=Marinobacter caseinilyticus TaxID=2692195 RepID=UPI00140E2187|nr:DNA repair protein RecO [Marinobacter caseinilyticus]
MTGSAMQEPAYVLHRRPYRETSLLVDVFALNAGRITLVARGGHSAKSPLKAQLQPFQPLLLNWQGRGELKTLTQTDVRQGPVLRRTNALYSGLYINELLQRVLPVGDPHPELFANYIETLRALSEAQDIEPVLRRFEWAFAKAMGLGFQWSESTDTGRPVEPAGFYGYDPEQGIVAHPSDTTRLNGLRGDVLLALSEGDLESPVCRRLAKRVMRVLVDHLMQGRPLHSRSLFSHGRGESNES